MSYQDIYGPGSSPSSLMKADPMLTGLPSPDPDELFAHLGDVSDVSDWFVEDSLAQNVEKPAPPSPPRVAAPVQTLCAEPRLRILAENRVEGTSVVPVKTEIGVTETPVAQHQAESSAAGRRCECSPTEVTRSARRGRPMKITSHSKQAMYAREYRQRNKQAMHSYERRVFEQNQEINALIKENSEYRKKYEELARQFNQLKQTLADCATVLPCNLGEVTLGSILSQSSVQLLLNSGTSLNGNEGVCIHVKGGSYSLAVCDICNRIDEMQSIKLENSFKEEQGEFVGRDVVRGIPFMD